MLRNLEKPWNRPRVLRSSSFRLPARHEPRQPLWTTAGLQQRTATEQSQQTGQGVTSVKPLQHTERRVNHGRASSMSHDEASPANLTTKSFQKSRGDSCIERLWCFVLHATIHVKPLPRLRMRDHMMPGKERPEDWDEIKTLGWPKGRRSLSWRAEFSLRVLVVSWNSISTMQAWVDVDCCTRGEWRQRRSNSVSTNGDVQASHWKWGHDKDHRQCSHEPAARRRYA